MGAELLSRKMVLFTNCTAARCHCSIKTVTGCEVVGGLSYCWADNELFHIPLLVPWPWPLVGACLLRFMKAHLCAKG